MKSKELMEKLDKTLEESKFIKVAVNGGYISFNYDYIYTNIKILKNAEANIISICLNDLEINKYLDSSFIFSFFNKVSDKTIELDKEKEEKTIKEFLES